MLCDGGARYGGGKAVVCARMMLYGLQKESPCRGNAVTGRMNIVE